MSKRVLFICNSAYQLLTAVQIRQTAFAADEADMILSDQLVGADTLAKNAQKTHLFTHVRFIHNKKQTFKNRFAETKNDICLIRSLRKELGEYDELFVSNISVFTILWLRFYQRKTYKVNLFEDGFVTYSNAFVEMDKASIVSRILCPKGVLGKASTIYLFNPDLLEWRKPNIAPRAIAKFNQQDSKTIVALNTIFDYSNCTDVYNKKYIFMEESFFADGFEVEDISIVEKIATHVGKENIMVKLHPRNPQNRFAALGYKTNTIYAIPWELIVLNNSFNDSTIISISSCSILQPYLLLGKPVKAIALLNMIKHRPGNMNGKLGQFMLDLFNQYPEICFCPQTEQQLIEAL